MLEQGVDRIVAQVVDPKINHIFRPQVERVVRQFLSPGSCSEEPLAPLPPAETKPDSSIPEQGTQHFMSLLTMHVMFDFFLLSLRFWLVMKKNSFPSSHTSALFEFLQILSFILENYLEFRSLYSSFLDLKHKCKHLLCVSYIHTVNTCHYMFICSQPHHLLQLPLQPVTPCPSWTQ